MEAKIGSCFDLNLNQSIRSCSFWFMKKVNLVRSLWVLDAKPKKSLDWKVPEACKQVSEMHTMTMDLRNIIQKGKILLKLLT